jgi:hypothetical protein
MKKNLFFAGIAAVLILAAAFTACSPGLDAGPAYDDPANGFMSELTALTIFNYTIRSDGGVEIGRFKSAAALGRYMAAAPTASMTGRSGTARNASVEAGFLYLCKIGDRNIVAIASRAFTPEPGNPDTDITTVVAGIKLAPTVRAIAADSFSGDFDSSLRLYIPPEVYNSLPGDVQQGLEDFYVGVEVSAYSVPAFEVYGKFPGTKTVNELHEVWGMPPYASGKYEGMAIYLDENLTREITGSTSITKNTLLYISAEGITPQITSYPGLDFADWPQELQKNGWNDGSGTNLYFRVSADGKALLCNPYGRGDGQGTYNPDVWLLEEAGAGAFPVGTWGRDGGDNEKLIFTSTTLTIDGDDAYQYNYVVSGDSFACTNLTLIPYTPTAEDLAEVEAFNETAFRASHNWIPDSSTITPTPTKQGVQYRIEDNPNMTFVDDTEVRGEVWTSIDLIINPDWFDPADTADFAVGDVWVNNLRFLSNGDLEFNGNAYGGYKWTKNLMKWGNDEDVVAPAYEIRTINGTAYLFVENKNGDYSRYSRKPSWYVLTR